MRDVENLIPDLIAEAALNLCNLLESLLELPRYGIDIVDKEFGKFPPVVLLSRPLHVELAFNYVLQDGVEETSPPDVRVHVVGERQYFRCYILLLSA